MHECAGHHFINGHVCSRLRAHCRSELTDQKQAAKHNAGEMFRYIEWGEISQNLHEYQGWNTNPIAINDNTVSPPHLFFQ